MIFPIELRVTRKNMTRDGKRVALQDINETHFAGTLRDVAMAHRVVFTDDNGHTRIIKNRPVEQYVVVDRPVFSGYIEVNNYIMRLERTLTHGNQENT